MPWGQNIQQKKHCNEFNKDLKKKKKRSTSKKILKRKKELGGKEKEKRIEGRAVLAK